MAYLALYIVEASIVNKLQTAVQLHTSFTFVGFWAVYYHRAHKVYTFFPGVSDQPDR